MFGYRREIDRALGIEERHDTTVGRIQKAERRTVPVPLERRLPIRIGIVMEDRSGIDERVGNIRRRKLLQKPSSASEILYYRERPQPTEPLAEDGIDAVDIDRRRKDLCRAKSISAGRVRSGVFLYCIPLFRQVPGAPQAGPGAARALRLRLGSRGSALTPIQRRVSSLQWV